MDWLAKFHAFSHLLMTGEGCRGQADATERKNEWVDSGNTWCRSAYGFPSKELKAAEDQPKYQEELMERMLESVEVCSTVLQYRTYSVYIINCDTDK